ncbi:MAG TPA: FtsX-like permease family protein [Flavobacterium sp.]|jgi:putative ABC transport system permease protein|nr:FtsX-like permease family protein [Flavobacterium sp.]
MIAKIAWRNITYKPLNTILSLILLTAAVAIISLLILLQEQFERQFSSNIDGIDLVIGAKGSPLQLILSSVYQMDAPTGNINYNEAKVYIDHPFAETAVPLAFGDNYKGYKILGTTPEYLEKFAGKLSTGGIFTQSFDVVIGINVARKLNLKVGDKFFSVHGDAAEGEVHENFPYKVTGIIEQTGKVADNLIICNLESVWAMHGDHAAESPAHGEEGHVHSEDEHEHEETADADKEITAVLVKLRNKMAFVMWPRMIAQNTKMQAASPAVEINRLFTLFGIGLTAMQYLAYGIMLISGISIFIALYNTLKERKYEFALMRIGGASRFQLLWLVLAESLFLCVTGFILGTIVGRSALWLISAATQEEYKMAFDSMMFAWEKEGILLLATIFTGILAAVIPAVKAYRLNISKTLANA